MRRCLTGTAARSRLAVYAAQCLVRCSLCCSLSALPEHIGSRDWYPPGSLQPEKIQLFSSAPLCEDDRLGSVVLGDHAESDNVVHSWARGSSAFRLNQDHLEKVAPLQSGAVLPMILSDCEQVHDAARLRLRRSTEINHVPPHPGTMAQCDQPSCHGARPLCRVLCLLSRSESLSLLCHFSNAFSTASATVRRALMRA